MFLFLIEISEFVGPCDFCVIFSTTLGEIPQISWKYNSTNKNIIKLSQVPISHFYYSQLCGTTTRTVWLGGLCPASAVVMIAMGQLRPSGKWEDYQAVLGLGLKPLLLPSFSLIQLCPSFLTSGISLNGYSLLRSSGNYTDHTRMSCWQGSNSLGPLQYTMNIGRWWKMAWLSSLPVPSPPLGRSHLVLFFPWQILSLLSSSNKASSAYTPYCFLLMRNRCSIYSKSNSNSHTHIKWGQFLLHQTVMQNLRMFLCLCKEALTKQ